MIAKDKPDRICVLVVEDDNFQRLGLVDLLSVLNYDCNTNKIQFFMVLNL